MSRSRTASASWTCGRGSPLPTRSAPGGPVPLPRGPITRSTRPRPTATSPSCSSTRGPDPRRRRTPVAADRYRVRMSNRPATPRIAPLTPDEQNDEDRELLSGVATSGAPGRVEHLRDARAPSRAVPQVAAVRRQAARRQDPGARARAADPSHRVALRCGVRVGAARADRLVRPGSPTTRSAGSRTARTRRGGRPTTPRSCARPTSSTTTAASRTRRGRRSPRATTSAS